MTQNNHPLYTSDTQGLNVIAFHILHVSARKCLTGEITDSFILNLETREPEVTVS